MSNRQCRACMRRRPENEVYDISRTGGGTFRRGGRSYRSSICIDCVCKGAGDRTEPDYGMQNWDRFPMRDLIRIRDDAELMNG